MNDSERYSKARQAAIERNRKKAEQELAEYRKRLFEDAPTRAKRKEQEERNR